MIKLVSDETRFDRYELSAECLWHLCILSSLNAFKSGTVKSFQYTR